jgi:toxin HigB-1
MALLRIFYISGYFWRKKDNRLKLHSLSAPTGNRRGAANILYVDNTRHVSYLWSAMIQGFADAATERFFRDGVTTAKWRSIAKALARKLDMVDAADFLNVLRAPPGNRLEALKGERKGQHSIRVNDRWRICFVWTEQGPAGVEIVDYHDD